MAKRRKCPPEEEPVDKAAERLRQFEKSRLPQEETDTSPVIPEPGNAQESLEPLPSTQKGESPDERSEG